MLGKLPRVETKAEFIKGRPEINSNFIPGISTEGEPRNFDLDRLIWWIKRTPECIGILKRIATDIITEFTFISVETKKTGRPRKSPDLKNEDRANMFADNNFLRQKLIAAVYDWLMTGDSYLWMGMLKDKQIKEIASKVYARYGIEMKEIETKQFFDEDFNNLTSIEVIPSSMTTIDHDETKIIKYIQRSRRLPSIRRTFNTSEVIHAKLMELDGKVYGFSPMQASFTSILTINAIADYGYNYFANGVKVDRAWLFSGNPNQDYIDKFQEQLQTYKRVRNAHGDIIAAGADTIKTEKLNEANEEMEYRQLAIHSVGRLAFAFNMPADILSSILGVDVKGTAIGSDIEDAGYNRNVEMSQTYWEEILNSQLFIPNFKVEIKFKRTFKQDQIRQAQYLSQVIPIAEFLFKHEYPVTDEYYHNILQIPREFLTTGNIKKEIEEMAQPFQIGNKDMKGANQQKQSEQKKKEQKPQQTNQPQVGA